MHQRSGRIFVAAILLAVMTTTAAADGGGQNDGGSGTDAGNTRSSATTVPLGTWFVGNKLRFDDVDWYAASVSGPGASCVSARVQASAPIYAALGAESTALALSAPFYADSKRDASGGIAGITPLTATLRFAQVDPSVGQAKYNFSITRLDATAATSDAGTGADAPERITSATPISPGCVGGTLGGLDLSDKYAIAAEAGQALTYTIGTTSSDVTLTLLDTLGNVLGPTIGAGESATIILDTSGTYYLSADQSTSLGTSSYAVGLLAGPEPSSCRPYCLD